MPRCFAYSCTPDGAAFFIYRVCNINNPPQSQVASVSWYYPFPPIFNIFIALIYYPKKPLSIKRFSFHPLIMRLQNICDPEGTFIHLLWILPGYFYINVSANIHDEKGVFHDFKCLYWRALLCQETTYPLCYSNRALSLADLLARAVNATE